MPLTTYNEVHKDKIEYTIQERFAPEIHQLRKLGFNEEFYIQETGFPLSFLVLLPIWALEVFRGGLCRVDPFLRAIVFRPYMIHEDTYAYGSVSKCFGTAYATMFDDGTLLHTGTHRMSGDKGSPKKKYIYQCPHPGNIALTWHSHVEKVRALADEGRNVIALVGMRDVVRISTHYDHIVGGGKSDLFDGTAKNKKR
jgi:hypothetical protein